MTTETITGGTASFDYITGNTGSFKYLLNNSFTTDNIITDIITGGTASFNYITGLTANFDYITSSVMEAGIVTNPRCDLNNSTLTFIDVNDKTTSTITNGMIFLYDSVDTNASYGDIAFKISGQEHLMDICNARAVSKATITLYGNEAGNGRIQMKGSPVDSYNNLTTVDINGYNGNNASTISLNNGNSEQYIITSNNTVESPDNTNGYLQYAFSCINSSPFIPNNQTSTIVSITPFKLTLDCSTKDGVSYEYTYGFVTMYTYPEPNDGGDNPLDNNWIYELTDQAAFGGLMGGSSTTGTAIDFSYYNTQATVDRQYILFTFIIKTNTSFNDTDYKNMKITITNNNGSYPISTTLYYITNDTLTLCSDGTINVRDNNIATRRIAISPPLIQMYNGDSPAIVLNSVMGTITSYYYGSPGDNITFGEQLKPYACVYDYKNTGIMTLYKGTSKTVNLNGNTGKIDFNDGTYTSYHDTQSIIFNNSNGYPLITIGTSGWNDPVCRGRTYDFYKYIINDTINPYTFYTNPDNNPSGPRVYYYSDFLIDDFSSLDNPTTVTIPSSYYGRQMKIKPQMVVTILINITLDRLDTFGYLGLPLYGVLVSTTVKPTQTEILAGWNYTENLSDFLGTNYVYLSNVGCAVILPTSVATPTPYSMSITSYPIIAQSSTGNITAALETSETIQYIRLILFTQMPYVNSNSRIPVYTINTLTLLNETTVDSVSVDYYTPYNFHVCG